MTSPIFSDPNGTSHTEAVSFRRTSPFLTFLKNGVFRLSNLLHEPSTGYLQAESGNEPQLLPIHNKFWE